MRIPYLAISAAAFAMSAITVVAQDALPAGATRPRLSNCQVAPISEEALTEAQERLDILTATPAATLHLEDADDPLEADELSEADLPPGMPVDAETVEAITAREVEFAACLNAGELRRAAALLTGDLQAIFVSYAGATELVGDRFATPAPLPAELQVPYVVVRDIRQYPDGRVGAIVDWGSERFFSLYERIDGRWRSSDEIRIFD